MPVPMLKKLASKSGKSLSSAEKYWEEAKVTASKKFGKKDSHYWAYVAGIVKKRMGVNESLRFKQFIKEEMILEVSEDNLAKIKKDCSQFIKESGGLPAFRGIEREPNFFTKTKSFSIARDSNAILTNTFNLYIEQKFKYVGIRSRNRVYTSGEAVGLNNYGDLYYVFPVNDYRFVWSPHVQDATTDILSQHEILNFLQDHVKNKGDALTTLNAFREFSEGEDNLTLSDLKRQSFYEPIILTIQDIYDELDYRNDNLKEALKSGNEIIFQTHGYYVIPCGKEVYEPDEAERSPPYKYWSDIRKNYKEIYARLT